MIKKLTGCVLLLCSYSIQAQNNFPNGIVASKGTSDGGSAIFIGTQYASHFHYSSSEDTYIRGGKSTSSVLIGDIGANVILGNAGGPTYTQGLFVAQKGINAADGIYATKGTNNSGSAVFVGSQYASHFHYSTTEDTYIRGGKSTSNIYISDVGNAVIVGSVPSAPAGYKLYVERGILTEKVKVALKTSGDWSDHVFEAGYLLKPLHEVEAFIKTNKHLPGVPSAESLVKDGGIDVNKMFAKQMEKIEELTLYMIELKKEITGLQEENKTLQANLLNLKNNRR